MHPDDTALTYDALIKTGSDKSNIIPAISTTFFKNENYNIATTKKSQILYESIANNIIGNFDVIVKFHNRVGKLKRILQTMQQHAFSTLI